MRNTLAAATVVALLALVEPAAGQPGASSEIAAIRAEIAALTARLDRLEQGSAPAGASPVPAAAAAPAAAQPARVVEPRVAAAVAPNLRFSGDLRYRHEAINEEIESERH